MWISKYLFLVCNYFLTLYPSESEANDYFSAVTGLESLLETEQVLLKELKFYVEYNQKHLQILENEMKIIEAEHEMASEDSENYLTNPVNVYRLMKRLYSDWATFEERISQKTSETYFLKQMADHRNTLSFPSEDDVDGSAAALVRLQDTYQLDVPQVAAGILNGIKYGNDMNWKDCFTLGERLWTMEEYNYTKKWYKESAERLSRESYAKDPYSLNFLESIAYNLYEMGDPEMAINLTTKILELDPSRTDIVHELEEIEKIPAVQLQDRRSRSPTAYSNSQEFKTYEKACRGELIQTPAEMRLLRCRFVHNNIPFRILAPFKVEEHNFDPLVLTLHEMISDENIQIIKSLATPHIQRSTVVNGLGSKVSDVRVCKNSWLPYTVHNYTQQMLRDIHDATGLDMTYSEHLQVANYGVGGHYEPHFDFFLDGSRITEEEGNRVATALYYLTDVEQGGATAFPFLRIAVKPQKGAVLFWYNLHESGDLDYRTKHAGCPVLKGSKWIANIWVHERTQFLARPCRTARGNEVSLKYQDIV